MKRSYCPWLKELSVETKEAMSKICGKCKQKDMGIIGNHTRRESEDGKPKAAEGN